MRDMSDERLQDYFDGRLTEDERADIEARLAMDADLARRVSAWREMRQALRAEKEDLPAGFYARARERFQLERVRRPAGWRLLSWEAAGLATAVLLVAALFVPELARRESRPSALGEERKAVREGAPVAPPAPAAGIGRAEPFEGQVPLEAAKKNEAEEVDRDAAPEDAADRAQSVGRSADVAEEGFAPAPEEGPAWTAGSVPSEATGQAASKSDGPAAPAPRREKSSPPPAIARQDARARAPASDATSPRPEAIGVAASRESAVGDGVAVGPVVDLPAGLLPAGALRIVTSESEWGEWLAGPAGAALAALGDPDASHRLVLVGAVATNCGTWTVTRGEDGYRVHPAGEGAAAGCAFVLPRDGASVTVDGSGGAG